MTPKFKPGDRVRRIEDRDVTGATVSHVESVGGNGPDDEPVYALDYDEGGIGYWPESALDVGDEPSEG